MAVLKRSSVFEDPHRPATVGQRQSVESELMLPLAHVINMLLVPTETSTAAVVSHSIASTLDREIRVQAHSPHHVEARRQDAWCGLAQRSRSALTDSN